MIIKDTGFFRYHNGTVVLENKSPNVLKIHIKLKMKLYFGFDIIFKIIS